MFILNRKFSLLFVLLTYLLASACGQAAPTPNATLPPPQVTSLAQNDLPTEPPAPTPTATILPTTNTPAPVLVPTDTEPSCTNQAEFVKSLSISDGTNLNPGASFTKIWQVRNVGTCTWINGYQLVLIGGDQMQAPYYVDLPHEVKPQETVDLAVKLVAPSTPATYTNNWVLKDAAGNYFGVGTYYDQPLVVQITVPVEFKGKPT